VPIVDVLERVEPNGNADLAAALGAEAQAGRSDHGVLLSDMLVEADAREAILRRLAAAARRPMLLHVLGDCELTPDLNEAVTIDSETGEEVPVRGGNAARKLYTEALERWCAEIEQRCNELGIIYAPAFTTVSARMLVAGDLRRRRVTEAARGGGR
jgi:hypothetical protein